MWNNLFVRLFRYGMLHWIIRVGVNCAAEIGIIEPMQEQYLLILIFTILCELGLVVFDDPVVIKVTGR